MKQEMTAYVLFVIILHLFCLCAELSLLNVFSSWSLGLLNCIFSFPYSIPVFPFDTEKFCPPSQHCVLLEQMWAMGSSNEWFNLTL